VNTTTPTPEEEPEDDNDDLGLNELLKSIQGATKDPDTQAKDREQQLQERIVVLRQSWGVQKRHRDAEVDRSGPWAAKLAAICAKVTQPSKGATFGIYGTRGNGKTQMAVEAMREVTGLGMSARYIQSTALFLRLKATFLKSATETEAEILAEFRKPKLLVIDEIGKRGESIWQDNLMFHLIDMRYGDMNDTILIANLEEEAFVEVVGSSVADRMNEGGGMIHANWPSRR